MQDRSEKSKTRMVRKQIFITADQNRRLKATARTRNCAASAVIRSAIDQATGAEAEGNDWKRQLLAFAGSLSATEADDMEKTVKNLRASVRKRLDGIERRLRSDR